MILIVLNVFISLASEFSFADTPGAIVKTCTQLHKAYKSQCFATDISKDQSVGSRFMSYSYEACSSGETYQLYLDNLAATDTTPAYSSCTTYTSHVNSGSRTEVRTSLGTTLIVRVDGTEVTTTIVAPDGELMCKTKNEKRMCFAIVKPESEYRAIDTIPDADMTPALFGKKKIIDYAFKTVKGVKGPRVTAPVSQ